MLTPHGIQCHPSDGSLPDGHWLHYQRNGQGQVTALVRSPVQRPWLRTLAAEDAIASHLQRNLAGLQSYTAGNGIHSQWLRDGTGTLAGIVHSRPAASQRQLHAQAQTQTPLWPATASVVQRLLGIGNAQASNPTTSATIPATLAFFDERYLWSGDGLLLHSRRSRPGGAEQRYWAYDGAGQLVAGVQTGQQDTQVWRYAYQGQRRVLAQHTNNQQELSAGTTGTAWDAQGRPTSQDAAATYNANGQPTGQGQRSYQWDSLGRLIAISQNNAEIARYRYDHRGLRIAKDAGGHNTGYLYSADRHLLAELNASGHMERQYIYLADLLLAVIDTPKGAKLAQTVEPSTEPLEQTIGLWADVKALLSSYLPDNATLAYIHSNHLGAPEAATNENGELVWQASYAPFGAASIQNSQEKPNNTFTLNIRLPGQYFDEETGLHYNRQRYYDPAQGAYLTPDPLGHPDGPNAYAYVANNPLGWIDPDGLVLFAFDGTGNSNQEDILNELGNGISNVFLFQGLYEDGNTRYVSGVGTRHRETNSKFGGDIFWNWGNTSTMDMGGNYTGPTRIERMIAYFNAEADIFEDSKIMNVDIIGFSRGAAQARDFANRINTATKNGQYTYTVIVDGKEIQKCQMINFRFLGLWDTVLSTNFSNTNYDLSIVQEFQHVAQAVALNEYRGDTFRRLPDSTGAFPLESIMGGTVPFGQKRIEMGFIGAHADIGGGFAGEEDGLPLIALHWMVEQARDAGVKIGNPNISIVKTNAILHDKSDNQYCLDGPGCSEDRVVRGGSGGTQRQMTGTGMTYANTAKYITYDPAVENADGSRTPGIDARTGVVDVPGYLKWLTENGYKLGNLKF